MDYEKTGNLIQEARIEKEMTQAQLAELLGVTDKAISKWERGKSFPDVAMLKPLAQALDLSVLELLDGQRQNEAPLSNEEKEASFIRGLQIYYGFKERSSRIYILLLAACVALLCLCGAKWVYNMYEKAHQPVDFTNGSYDFSEAVLKDKDGNVISVDFTDAQDQIIKEEIKQLLAKGTANMEEKKHFADVENYGGEISLGTLVSFEPDEYYDFPSGKHYTGSYIDQLYEQLWSILSDYAAEKDEAYRYDGKKQYQYENRVLTVECEPKNAAEAMIVESFRQQQEKLPLSKYPDAYKTQVRLQSMKWIRPEKYGRERLHRIEKEIAYQELYDYRIYEVMTSETYTNALKKLKPQMREGRRTYLYLLGKKPGDTQFSVCYFAADDLS